MIAVCTPWWLGAPKAKVLPVRSGWVVVIAVLAVLAASPSTKAQEAWLVTYGPGEEIWEMFGHNALWLRDPETGLDHAYSFGYFEIDRAGFYFDFARGIMNYYGAASPAEREFEFYRQRGRSVTAQKLGLGGQQVQDLQKALHEAIYPAPQFYAYDYFRANCSTWLRDLINQVIDDKLRPTLTPVTTERSLADQIRRLTIHRPWVQTGILALMGPSIDRPLTAWEEAFLPEALAHWIGSVEVDGQPLVTEEAIIYAAGGIQSSFGQQSGQGLGMLMPMLASLAIALIMLLLMRKEGASATWAWRSGVLIIGLLGAVLLAMMVFSGHHDTRWNVLLLLLHPMWWFLLLPMAPRPRRMLAFCLGFSALIGTVILAWPALLQDRPGVLFAVVPVLLATLWGVFRTDRQAS